MELQAPAMNYRLCPARGDAALVFHCGPPPHSIEAVRKCNGAFLLWGTMLLFSHGTLDYDFIVYPGFSMFLVKILKIEAWKRLETDLIRCVNLF